MNDHSKKKIQHIFSVEEYAIQHIFSVEEYAIQHIFSVDEYAIQHIFSVEEYTIQHILSGTVHYSTHSQWISTLFNTFSVDQYAAMSRLGGRCRRLQARVQSTPGFFLQSNE
jgi:hypothetical protein